ncbi:MAG: aspartate carbamoyltransferase regulatory subunit [Candidatus Micrarchaeota archaeon]|nr:aspartate carbamoyltransferase regulatory subunit [Candidatus Micrarchaeota archaeon]
MTDKENEFLKAKKIETGTVIDHIPAARALEVLRVLGVTAEHHGAITVLMNVPSSHYGHKDIIKIEGKKLAKKEVARIALIAPTASVNTIQNFSVVDKYVVQTPKVLEGVVKCPNPNCITSREGTAKLHVETPSPLCIRCQYCEKVYDGSELSF